MRVDKPLVAYFPQSRDELKTHCNETELFSLETHQTSDVTLAVRNTQGIDFTTTKLITGPILIQNYI